MNKAFIIIAFSTLLLSCIGKHNSDAQKVTVTNKNSNPIKTIKGDTIQIDPVKSNIYWKGTKMRGAGKHEGKIALKNGHFIIKNKQIIGGKFLGDMTSIGVTDIPEHESVPIKNLNNHLKSVDFFDVEKFPISKFQITKIEQITKDSLHIRGNFTLKDITKNIAFGASYQNKSFTTKFIFDRFQWNIAYKGNIADKTLVDKDIELKIELIMR